MPHGETIGLCPWLIALLFDFLSVYVVMKIFSLVKDGFINVSCPIESGVDRWFLTNIMLRAKYNVEGIESVSKRGIMRWNL